MYCGRFAPVRRTTSSVRRVRIDLETTTQFRLCQPGFLQITSRSGSNAPRTKTVHANASKTTSINTGASSVHEHVYTAFTCFECMCGVESNENARGCSSEHGPDETCPHGACNHRNLSNRVGPCLCGSFQFRLDSRNLIPSFV